MRKWKGYLISGALVTGFVVFTWNYLLDARAKESLRVMFSKTTDLANKLVATYMGDQVDEVEDEKADETNREWIRYQWKQAGY